MKIKFKTEPYYKVPLCCKSLETNEIELKHLVYETLQGAYRGYSDDGTEALSLIEDISRKMSNIVELLVERKILPLNEVISALELHPDMFSNENLS